MKTIYLAAPDSNNFETLVSESYVKSGYIDAHPQDFDNEVFLSDTPIYKEWTTVNLLTVDDKHGAKE